jgi:hypothetical protein
MVERILHERRFPNLTFGISNGIIADDDDVFILSSFVVWLLFELFHAQEQI